METGKIAILLSILAIIIAGASLMIKPQTSNQFIEETKVNTSHGVLTLGQIAEIQPGLGTVMMEYGNRFYIMYYAAKDGNWGLASYQLKEAKEIQEVGETTRSARASMLKSFESTYLEPLNNTINTKNWNDFQIAYNNTIIGCNGCHSANQFPYIKYVLPSSPPNIP